MKLRKIFYIMEYFNSCPAAQRAVLDAGGSKDSKWAIDYILDQRFSNCGPRTTSGPRVLPLWSF